MRNELLINLLELCGLVLIGAGVWLAFGLAATLIYAGVALLVFSMMAVLIMAPAKRGRP